MPEDIVVHLVHAVASHQHIPFVPIGLDLLFTLVPTQAMNSELHLSGEQGDQIIISPPSSTINSRAIRVVYVGALSC